MENAADALKMAAFTLIFVMALGIAMVTFSQARATSEAILYTHDEKNYYSYINEDEYNMDKTNRIVTMEQIVPNVYRYYKEKFRIEFYESNGTTPIELYKTEDVRWKQEHGGSNVIYFLDLDDESIRGMPNNWGTYKDRYADYIVGDILMKNYKDKKFIEQLGQENVSEETDDEIPDVNQVQKRVIKYTLKN